MVPSVVSYGMFPTEERADCCIAIITVLFEAVYVVKKALKWRH